MSSDKKSFFDSNTILALIITFAVFFGWQEYLKKKYPNAVKSNEISTLEENQNKTNEKTTLENSKVEKIIQPHLKSTVEVFEEKTFAFKDSFWEFELSSKGMSLKNIIVKKINKVAQRPYKFISSEEFFPTEIEGKAVEFNVSKVSENEFIGRATIFNSGTLTKKIKIDSEKYLVKVSLSIEGVVPQTFDLNHTLVSNIEDPKKAVFFLPAFERNELYINSLKDSERVILNTSTVSEAPEVFGSVNLLSIGDHYFTSALLSNGSFLPQVNYIQNKKEIKVTASHRFSKEINIKTVNYDLFIGPKRLDLMESISEDLVSVVNFSFLGFIAKPIIKILNVFFNFFGNYGIAVIVLTFLIRLMILPLAVSSTRSMKKMQKIQPRLKEIKEKYKADPQKVNQLTMKLMKDEKVNPLGGCLPMVLQLPIFFAFYRGLSESVDLYQAPFFLWVNDLSKMDPYFIFPILSMVGMVVHQLVTPSTMDKMQKRMMMIMPVVFGALFVTLPSALTLYMSVSTWFGIGQHYIFLREKK